MIIITLMIIGVLHHTFVDRQTIGGDERYFVFIICSPIILGLIFLWFYRKSFITKIIMEKESIGNKLIHLCFILIQGVFVSFFSFGILANAIWNQLNIRESKTTTSKIIDCKIEGFHFESGSRDNNKIYFYYNNEFEGINAYDNSFEKYKKEDPSNYIISIKVNKGIWEYYIINGWKIKKRSLTPK